MKPIKIYLSLLLLCCTFSLTAQSENALNFDGVNDAVNLPAGLNGAIGSYTLQAWIKTTDASGVRAIVVRSGFHGIFLNNNFLAFYNWSTGNFVGGSSVALNDNQWHHVAATFTHGISFSGQLYIDGVPTGGGFTPGINSVANNYSIGHNLNGQFFNGNIDNVIIHNRVLNATEILDSYNSCSVATGNLKASYNFNHGISQGNNAGINTLLDQSGNNYSGTLVNFTLSGSASNWVDGRSCCFSLASISGATSYCLGETFNLTASFSPRIGESITSYQWKKNGVNLSDGGNVSGATSANLQIANTVSSDFGTYSVEVTSTCGNASASSNITQLGLINLSNLVAHYPFDNNSAIDVSGNNYNATGLNIISTVNRFNQANSAFSFDGVASNVTIAAPTGQTILGNGQNKSISLWFKRSSTTSKGMLLSYQQATPGSWNPLAYIGNDGVLRGWMYQGGTAPWSSGVIIDTNWHHLALVYTTNVQTVYLDGSQVTTMSGTLSPGASNIIMIGNGYANTGITGISVTGNQPFSGIIDEVRFYNAALSLADVNTIATTPFIITNQPQGVCAPIGSQASVSINVSGSVTYQWRQNGINIPGATSNTYTISNVQSSDFGLYSCVIASQCDNTISSVSNEVSVGLPISIPQPSRVYTFNNHHEDHLLRGAYHSVLNQTTNTPATLGSDRFGAANSAHFRGNWSSVSLNRALNLPNMTISMWVNLNNATGTHVFLSPPTNTLPYHLFSENGQLKIRPSSGSDIIIPYVLPSSGWVQITMVYQGNTNIVYVNGEHKFTTSTGINPSTNAIGTIAGLPGGAVTARYLLDDVYVFEQAFTAAEVEGLYADGDKVPYFYIEPINDLVCESNAIRFNFQSAVPGSLVTVKKNGVDLPAGGNVLITDTSVVITNPTSADFTNYTISIRNGCGSVSKTVNAVNYSPGFESIGLVRYFMFNNNLNDAQGGPSLSVGGGINYTSDRFGNANAAYQQYNGSILLLPSTAVVNNSPFTVNFWVNGYPTGSSYQLFSSGSPTSVGLSAQNQYLGFSLGNNNVGFKQYNAFTGGWCMLTMSFDGQIVKIYSNEKLVSVHRPQNATTYLQTFIDQLQCQIDDIRIYNRVLADEEVRGLYRISNITQQPQNQSVCEGQTANLSVNAQNMGGNNLTYQWNFNGNPLSDGGGVSGANTNNLQISNAQASNAGTYNCIINSGCTDINSLNVTLSVGAGNVNITQQPQSISVCAGSPTSFSTATQGATVTYQWKKDGANISGATNSTLNLSNVSLAEAGSYTVDIIGGSCGTISSQSGTLTIFSLPLASITPASPTICSGQSIALTANGGTSYSWDNGLGLGDVITVTPTSNTTYTVLVSDANNCTANASQTVTVINNSAPTGTATQTFCNSATVANLSSIGTAIQWYAASTGGTALSAGTALTDGTTYYATQTVSGCESSSRLEVTVTINSPLAPSGLSTQTFCSGATVGSLSANGTNMQWYTTSTGGSPIPTTTVLQDGLIYYVSQTIDGCESVGRLEVTAAFGIPSAPTGLANQTFCNSASVANLLASGSNIKWYANQTGGTTLLNSVSLTNGSTYYATQTSGGCESTDRLAVNVTINVPAVPTGNTLQEFCNSATVASLATTGTDVQWYTSSTGGTALSAGTVLSNATTYYASQTISGCESAIRLEVAVTINTPAVPVGAATQSFCGSATLADLSATGTTLLWYDAASAGNTLSTSLNVSSGATYFVSQTINGCESIDRLAVQVTINSIPSAPTGSAAQSFCNAGTVSDLTAVGSNIQWYANSTGGTALSVGTAFTNGLAYYASQTSGACESTDRLEVTVTINSPAAPTGSATQEFCNTGTIAELISAGSDIQWYTASTGGSALGLTTALVNGTYYASQTISGCESADRFAVTVTINIPAAPAGNTNQNFCGSALVSDIAISGSNITWYDAASAGNVLLPTTALVDGSTYYANQTISGCESLNQLAVAVSVNAIPSAPAGAATQEFCNGATIAELAVTGTALTWYASAISSSPLSSSTSMSNGTTYFASQTVNGCESSDRLQVAVTINAPAIPSGNPTQTFCSAATVNDLNATGTDIAWYSAATGGTPLASSLALSNGTYYASQTINGCESANRLAVAVTVTILNSNVTQSGITLTAAQSGANYTWVDCNNGNQPIAGASGQSYTPTANGSYAVEIDLNGCSTMSSCVQITSVGLEEDKVEMLNIQPNPTSGMLIITVSQPTDAVVTASNGTIITTLKLEGETVLDATKYATGVYYLRTSEGQTVKFIKE